MQFNEALKRTGGDSVGGQLIVHRDGTNILVGRHHDGHLIVEDTDDARKVMASLGHPDHLGPDKAYETPSAGAPKKPRTRKLVAEITTDPTEVVQAEDPIHHEVVIADDAVTADALGGGD